MYKMEKAFLELLKNNIKIDDVDVPVIRRPAPLDQTPCITIQQVDEYFLRKRIIQINNIQYLEKEYRADLWINLWCNTENERQDILQQIEHRILQAEANYYTTCSNYHEGMCSAINDECLTLTRNTGRTLKGLCPDTDIWCSFFKHHHIKRSKFYINSRTDLDELNTTQPILRSILKLKMDYSTYYPIGGITFDRFQETIE